MIRFEIENYEKLLDVYDPKLVKKAYNAAVRKVGAKAKTEVGRLVTARYNLPKKRVNKTLNIHKNKNADGIVEYILDYKGRRIGLQNFASKAALKKLGVRISVTPKHSRFNKKRIKRRGIKVRVRKGGPLVWVERGFVQRGKNQLDTYHIFKRINENSPKEEYYRATVQSVPRMIDSAEVLEPVQKLIGREMNVEFTRAMNHFLEKSVGLR